MKPQTEKKVKTFLFMCVIVIILLAVIVTVRNLNDKARLQLQLPESAEVTDCNEGDTFSFIIVTTSLKSLTNSKVLIINQNV